MSTRLSSVALGCLCCLLALPVAARAGAGAGEPITPLEYRRGPEQTFLTFPEWFLVYSPAEYADYVKGHTPTGFPFFAHIGQFWSSYSSVYRETKAQGYPFNYGYHVMIMVIGSSTAVEYSARGLYESSAGALSSSTLGGDLSDEDRYAAAVAQDYVDFIRVNPWYEFDFAHRLGGLWRTSSFFGPHFFHKLERKFAYSTEYGVKSAYGFLIKVATKASYDTPSPVTAVVLDRLPDLKEPLKNLRVLRRFEDQSVLITVPRYQEFLPNASELALSGGNFIEIAGNRGPILVSTIVADHWQPAGQSTRVLFEQEILTHPGYKRVALVVSVSELGALLRGFHATGTEAEHIYDY